MTAAAVHAAKARPVVLGGPAIREIAEGLGLADPAAFPESDLSVKALGALADLLGRSRLSLVEPREGGGPVSVHVVTAYGAGGEWLESTLFLKISDPERQGVKPAGRRSAAFELAVGRPPVSPSPPVSEGRPFDTDRAVRSFWAIEATLRRLEPIEGAGIDTFNDIVNEFGGFLTITGDRNAAVACFRKLKAVADRWSAERESTHARG